MQSLMFVFIGVPANKLHVNLSSFSRRIAGKLNEKQIDMEFEDKGKLLVGNFNDASYYVSILQPKEALTEWYQMAIDFELKLEKKPITKDELKLRYTELKKSKLNPYEESHFTAGEIIFDEMEKISEMEIYSFQ